MILSWLKSNAHLPQVHNYPSSSQGGHSILIESDRTMNDIYYVFYPKYIGQDPCVTDEQFEAEQKRRELIEQRQREGGLTD
ncbi:hypothetical protein [Vibrio nomapromontoriensis]|uniref:hypothetical protein n=1 Tax=Vibrio nomapromontoriensis TaxID=2910246 RepID=UPI003D097D45